MNRRFKAWLPESECDGLGWPLLTFEEREFLGERGYMVIDSPTEPPRQLAVHARPELWCRERPGGGTARLVLHAILREWGGDFWVNRTPWNDRRKRGR